MRIRFLGEEGAIAADSNELISPPLLPRSRAYCRHNTNPPISWAVGAGIQGFLKTREEIDRIATALSKVATSS